MSWAGRASPALRAGLLEPLAASLARARLGDGAEVLDHLVAAHADAVVARSMSVRAVAVGFEADLEDLAAGDGARAW